VSSVHLFFLEHAGELLIIILRRRKFSASIIGFDMFYINLLSKTYDFPLGRIMFTSLTASTLLISNV
jgi:hypothetical protein